jgi:poly(ribitol-phosphate) beta-N-acetylglucosaminyltransferase
MPKDVSVVIPMFNAGANLEDCLDSLLDQTLERERFEVLILDDGSTDGSDVRADEWAKRHPELITVHHLAASGGPAHPRNVGIERSSGRYIQFLDSDDSLGPRALERLLEVADESDADIVLPKLSCNFRGVHHPIFRKTVTHRTLADYPLMQNANVSKLVRREFLFANNVRFPEGPQYIEDTTFCLLAYAHAKSVAVVGDTACYFYRRRRTGGPSIGETVIVPADYYRELAAMFDIVDMHVTPAAARLEVLGRFYRNEMLRRVGGRQMLNYDDDYLLTLITEIQHLAKTRLPAEVHESLPMFIRTQSRLLLESDAGGLVALARHLSGIRLTGTCQRPAWRDGVLVLDIDAHLTLDREPLCLERNGTGWAIPTAMAPTATSADRQLTDVDWADLDLDVATISRADSSHWSTIEGLTLNVDAAGCPRITGQVALDPRSVMGGSPLTTGLWDLRLSIRFGGLIKSCSLVPTDAAATQDTWFDGSGQTVSVICSESHGGITLDVDEWSQPLAAIVAAEDAAGMRVSAGRLTIDIPHLLGLARESAAVAGAVLILEPLDDAATAPVPRVAQVMLGPTGSTLTADLEPLPAASQRWAPWLRFGDIGGSPAQRLPIEVTPSTDRS